MLKLGTGMEHAGPCTSYSTRVVQEPRPGVWSQRSPTQSSGPARPGSPPHPDRIPPVFPRPTDVSRTCACAWRRSAARATRLAASQPVLQGLRPGGPAARSRAAPRDDVAPRPRPLPQGLRRAPLPCDDVSRPAPPALRGTRPEPRRRPVPRPSRCPAPPARPPCALTSHAARGRKRGRSVATALSPQRGAGARAEAPRPERDALAVRLGGWR